MADVRLISSEDDVYALSCVYPLEAAEGFGTRLAVMADTFALTSPAAAPELAEEEQAFAKARAVMEGLQDSAIHIRTVCRYSNMRERDYTEDFLYDSDVGFLMVTASAGGETQAILGADERTFTNQGEETNGNRTWRETEPPSGLRGPWLGEFHFIRHYVTWLDSHSVEGLENIMFLVDAPFEDTADAASFYFATFRFDQDDNFVDVSLYINPGQDDAYTLIQSIVSTDRQTIDAEIINEFEHAAK